MRLRRSRCYLKNWSLAQTAPSIRKQTTEVLPVIGKVMTSAVETILGLLRKCIAAFRNEAPAVVLVDQTVFCHTTG
ncbi:unnamed protein product [Toxocara canis]|uniref:Transposase n=1 Tax=Toxocara canis TaxID=6265 RepID=A0A183U4B5_TOXCA|nr:unnamed protein product [Toxocara canis]